jgi:hypothetical protein
MSRCYACGRPSRFPICQHCSHFLKPDEELHSLLLPIVLGLGVGVLVAIVLMVFT